MKKLLAGLSVSLVLLAQAKAQEKVDEKNSAKMRSEELEHSQIMQTLHVLTDRYGPRVTGTPNHEMAARWAIAEMTKWGFKNAHLEPWEFGHPGWLNESATARLVLPVKQNLKFEVIAWTPSTQGRVTGSTFQIIPPVGPEVPPPAAATAAATDAARVAAMAAFGGGRGGPARLGPTKEEFAKWLAATKDRVRGKVVMVGKAAVIPVNFDPPMKRQPDERVKAQYDPANPNGGRGGGRGGAPTPDPTRVSANEIAEQIDAMLAANGALARVNDAARGEGIIVAVQHRGYDVATAVPTIVVRNDDFGRMERLMADGDEVKVELDIANHIYPEGKTSYNAIAEIPGSDKADEVVMLGGHLDSVPNGRWLDGCRGVLGASETLRQSAKSTSVAPPATVRLVDWADEEGARFALGYLVVGVCRDAFD